jgi:hypothetical protein
MRIHKLSSLVGLVASATSLFAQSGPNCSSGPGSAYGIVAYQCANCGFKHESGRPASFTFFAEPVVTQVDRSAAFATTRPLIVIDGVVQGIVAVGDVIEAVDGHPITTQAGADLFAYPTPGSHSLTVRRGREREVLDFPSSPSCDARDGGVGPTRARVASMLGALRSRADSLRFLGDTVYVRGDGVSRKPYPHPFNPEVFIPFDVDTTSCTDGSRQHAVSMRILSVLAQQVAVPVLYVGGNNTRPSPSTSASGPMTELRLGCGFYTAYWDGKIQGTSRDAASGRYVVQLLIDGKLAGTTRIGGVGRGRSDLGSGGSAASTSTGRGEAELVDRVSDAIDGIRSRSAAATTGARPGVGKFGFAVECQPSCTTRRRPNGEYYFKYDGYPRIIEVRERSAANRAGLQVGDVITKVEGRSILAEDALHDTEQKDQLHMTIRRDGKDIEVVMVVVR